MMSSSRASTTSSGRVREPVRVRGRTPRNSQGHSRESHEQNVEEDSYSHRPSESDVRISRLVRLMSRLDSEESFFKYCGQIEDLIQRSNDNRKYITRSFHMLTIPLTEVIHGLTGLPWKDAGLAKFAELLVRIINTMDTQFSRVWQWILEFIDKKARSQRHYESSQTGKALLLMLMPKLTKAQNKNLITSIQEFLEQAPNAEIFKLYCSLYLNCLLPFQETKVPHFEEFIDIVIGWMVDENEDPKVIPPFCAEILKDLEPYFKNDTNFSKSLVLQILEDLEQASNLDEKDNTNRIIKTTRLLRAYSSIINMNCQWEKQFFVASCERLFFNTNRCIKENEKDGRLLKFQHNLLKEMNEFVALCGGIDGPCIRQFILKQLGTFVNDDGWMNHPTLVVNDLFLALISWIETVITINQPDDEVKKIFRETLKFIDSIQPNATPTLQQKIIRTVQSLLRTRNVVMLQTVYEWITGKLSDSPLNDNSNYTAEDLEKKLFVLACLSDIATNKTGSILSLWALTPSIFDLLMDLMDGAGVDRMCLLEILRAHCSAHSHFVSSIALSRSYLAESPGTRFLHTLMNFWTDKMLKENLTQVMETWVFNWISDFIKSSAHYSALLVETEHTFYKTVIRQLMGRSRLRERLGNLLTWMIKDPHYKKCGHILTIIREMCIRILLNNDSEPHLREMFSNLFKTLPFLLLIEPEFEDYVVESEVGDGKEKLLSLDEPLPSFTIPDFNSFLFDLFVSDKNEFPATLSSENLTGLKAAVEFLIQSKLKTSVGRPQDFFFHLQNMLKRYRSPKVAGKTPMPEWKLEFIYELERRLVCCIFESSFVMTGISENLRSFYLTNKTPCIEWLKRMRADLIEISIASKSYPAAYYFATISGDDLKAKYALLELEDLEGLAGSNEMAGFYYLKGEFEKVKDIMESAEPDMVKDAIKQRTETILKTACGELQNWESDESTPGMSDDTIFQIPSNTKSFVNIQLEAVLIGKKHPIEILGNINNMYSYDILDLVKVRGLMKRMPDLSPDQILNLDCIIVNRMIDLGNITFVREWLTHHTWIDLEGKMNSNPRVKVEYFLILAEVLYQDNQWEESAKMYLSMLNLLDVERDLPNDFKCKVLLKFGKKLADSEEFYIGIARNSSVTGFFQLQPKGPIIQDVLDKAVIVSPLNESVWFQYADFSYERAQKEESPYLKDVYKASASHCYERVMNLGDCTKQSKNSIVAMARLIKLYKEGQIFDPAEVIIDLRWLTLLPELAFIHEFRIHLLSRFPEQSTFLIATYAKPESLKRFSNRRGIFDPSAYAFAEASDEPFQGACQITMCEFPIRDGNEFREETEIGDSTVTRELRFLISENMFVIVEEMERIGTSREELWSWSVHRIAGEWIKRLAVLRKDLAREDNEAKVKAYVAPVWTFLNELWLGTRECNSPSELAFVCRHGDAIKVVLNRLFICKTAEEFEEILEVLLKCVGNFDSVTGAKLAIGNLSPILSNFDFVGSRISLPGFRSGVTIANVHSIITCLATKTKPKRLMFRGSDGKKYEYLVKGNENLNIDSRIMQLLSASALFIDYPTRTYSVTPLGDRGGLIQIVEDAMPLFTLYKKYLTRNNCSDRPSEMFWRRLEALGFSDRSNLPALVSVFEELQTETSTDLLSRELFLCAQDTKSWYNSVRTFTRDCAVGSCIGYIVGVGDRHLDNILLNPEKGHLVHVDFSILFDRGANLRIPEKVPFRLTQNFASALQHPGLPGPFNTYVDRILHLFQVNREIVEFCVGSIAYAHQIEEGIPVDPIIILKSELRSAMILLQQRANDINLFMKLVVRDILEACGETRNPLNAWTTRLDTLTTGDKITKKIYRWRRLLANIDPLIQFIASNAKSHGMLTVFKAITIGEWTPNVMHFWSHTKVEQVTNLTSVFVQRFEFTSATLDALLRHVPPLEEIIRPKENCFADSHCHQVDKKKVDALMDNVKRRISSVDSTTAEELIKNAINKENLAQMYEGWTPWV